MNEEINDKEVRILKQENMLDFYKKALFESNAIKSALYDKVEDLESDLEIVQDSLDSAELHIDDLQEQLGCVEKYEDDISDNFNELFMGMRNN